MFVANRGYTKNSVSKTTKLAFSNQARIQAPKTRSNRCDSDNEEGIPPDLGMWVDNKQDSTGSDHVGETPRRQRGSYNLLISRCFLGLPRVHR